MRATLSSGLAWSGKRSTPCKTGQPPLLHSAASTAAELRSSLSACCSFTPTPPLPLAPPPSCAPTSVAAVGVGQGGQEVVPAGSLVAHRRDDHRLPAVVHLPERPLVLRRGRRGGGRKAGGWREGTRGRRGRRGGGSARGWTAGGAGWQARQRSCTQLAGARALRRACPQATPAPFMPSRLGAPWP